MKLYPEITFKFNPDLVKGRKHLLIIDDDELFLKSMETVLVDEYDLDLCQDPAIATSWLEQQKYDVVILDYNMEPFNGLEAIRKIRQKDHRTGLILITGYGTFDLAVEAMSLGITALLSKPVQINQLKDAIRAATQERYLLDQLNKMETLSDTTIVNHHVLETQKNEIDKLKELLRWTYKQLEGTFNIIPDPMMVLDADMRIISLNHAAASQFRKPKSDLVGQYCYEAFGKKGIEDCIDCPSRRVLSIGLPAHSVFAEKPDQPNYLVSAIPIVDDIRQKLVSVVELRHSVNQLHTCAHGKSMVADSTGKLNILSEIRHEMNNMLSILRTVTEVIKLSIEKEQWDRARDTIPMMVENINRMSNYLKGLTSKGHTHQPHIIVVPEFVNRLIETISSQPLYRPIRFEKFWPEADIRIKANEEHLQEMSIYSKTQPKPWVRAVSLFPPTSYRSNSA